MTPNQQRPRTPKVKEFVHAPFVACPDCGEKNFGVLMICARQFTRRCTHCWYDKTFALPKIEKQLIYLDQFVISNMMKELDPSRPDAKKGSIGSFYRTLFETLDRLCKLQLITCPDSPVQNSESVVYSDYEKVRAVFRQLSHGLTMLDPEEVFYAQIRSAFDAYLNEVPTVADMNREFVLGGNPHKWQERYRIEMNYTVPGLIQELNEVAAARTKHLRSMCEELQMSAHFDFNSTFNHELSGYAKGILDEYATYVRQYMEAQARGAMPDMRPILHQSGVSLVAEMLSKAARTNANQEKQFPKVTSFFVSEHFRQIPFARMSALFWATLARDVRSSRKSENFPNGSMYNDVDVVSAYAPFCDAMFVDKEIAHLASQAELKKELVGRARLFSLRQREREAFIDYLKGIETNAPPEHLKLVREVYGESWGTPFLQLLSVLDRKQ